MPRLKWPRRRGSILLVLGLFDLLQFRYLQDQPPREPAAYHTHLAFLSFTQWAWIWLGTGIVCLLSAFTVKDQVGYFFAALLKMQWAGSFAYTWATTDDSYRSPYHFSLWTLLALIVVICGGWREPETVRAELLTQQRRTALAQKEFLNRVERAIEKEIEIIEGRDP